MNTLPLIFILLFIPSVSAQSLSDFTWTDRSLQVCVNKSALQNGWTDIQHVTKLKCHKMKISHAQELAKLTALKELSLFSNQISKLDLTALTQLESLNIANNRLTELDISGLHKLQTLYLFRNNLRQIDLAGLTSVTKIRLMQNKLTELDITSLTALQEGYFFDNQLEDLQITGLTKLTFLDVKQNPMPDELYDFYDEQEGIVISHDGNADDWQ